MKKLLLLTLVLLGGVMQVSADNYLKGSWNWSVSEKFGFDDNGWGTTTVNLDAGKTYEFGIHDSTSGNFYKNNGTMTSSNCKNWKFETPGGDNAKITTTIAGTYTFKVQWREDSGNWYPYVSVIYPTSETYIVHFLKPDGWDVYAYRYFDSTKPNEIYYKKWPGDQLTENINNSGYYDVSFSDALDRVTFSDNGEDASKSANIIISPSSTEYWVSNKDDENPTTSAPAGWVGYTRSVTSGNFGTICLPYDATVTGATVYKIVSKIMDGSTFTGVNLASVDALEAGKAYIFKATDTTLTATYTGGNPSAVSAAFGMMGNLSSTPVTVSEGNYVLKNNQICPVGENVTCGKYKGYITLDGIGETSAKGANFIGLDGYSEETDGIAELKTMGNVENGNIYNLAGQEVGANYKGIIVVNGKKVVRK